MQFKHEVILETVESVLYTRCSRILKEKYKGKNEIFNDKLRKIQSYSIKDLMDYLDIKNSFRLQKSSMNENGYRTAIDELNKLMYQSSPIDKLVD